MNNKEFQHDSKVGIVTYYRFNYGSILQCFATCTILKKKGYTPVVIDEKSIRSKHLLAMLSRCLAHPKHIREFYTQWRSQRASSLNSISQEALSLMEYFNSEELPVRVASASELKKIGQNPAYCAFLSGSDQIWNGHRFIVPSHHFLRFAPSHKRIAWAPSLGTSDVAAYNKRMYKKYISEYSSLSVRESNGVKIIKELTGLTPVQLIDPVFLLTKEEWASLVSANSYGKYALCYFLDRPNVDTVEKIAEYCRCEHAKPIVFGRMIDAFSELEDCIAVDGDPAEFVSMICNATCLFTDSFHGTSFAIIQHTPFFVFLRNYTHGVDQSSRLLSVLELCRMKEVFNPSTVIIPDYNFAFSDHMIEIKRIEMLDYLDNAIKKAQRGGTSI